MFAGRPLRRAPLVSIAAAVFAVACGGSSTASPTPADLGSGSLIGAGATFPAPFYQKAFHDYQAKYPRVTVIYQALSSGAGISAFQKGTVDFGASDVPMTDVDQAKVPGGATGLVQVPTTLGVIAITYNLSGVSKLQLDGPTLANIYLGHISKWNDAQIAALNSGVSLPNSAIQVVHRADSSGTTYHFTDYLSKVSDEWKTRVGVAKAVSWPAGVGAAQNAGVAQQVTSTSGAIGYNELAYVVQAGMSQAFLKNADGNYVQASVAGATAAASHERAWRNVVPDHGVQLGLPVLLLHRRHQGPSGRVPVQVAGHRRPVRWHVPAVRGASDRGAEPRARQPEDGSGRRQSSPDVTTIRCHRSGAGPPRRFSFFTTVCARARRLGADRAPV